MSTLPAQVQQTISDLCSGKKQIEVGHMMFSKKEGIHNIQLPYFMDLVRSAVTSYIDGDVDRMNAVTEATALAVADYVRKHFATARYPGD